MKFFKSKNKQNIESLDLPALPDIPEFSSNGSNNNLNFDSPPRPNDMGSDLDLPAPPPIPDDGLMNQDQLNDDSLSLPDFEEGNLDNSIVEKEDVSNNSELVSKNNSVDVKVEKNEGLDFPDFDSLELPDFPDFDVEETPVNKDEKIRKEEITQNNFDDSTLVSRIDAQKSGPIFIKVDVYSKITDTIQSAKEGIDGILEDGHNLMGVAGDKDKTIDSLKSSLLTSVKLLSKIESILFER